MGSYLCYDVRGIQSFIFRIPKLKYIIGGSALIDQFDRDTAPNVSVGGAEHLYSGGGKGAFACQTGEAADELKDKLVAEAHEIGVDIRFGRGVEFVEASRTTTDLYPFVPASLEGVPCPKSGLYPVGPDVEEHPVVHKRLFREGRPTFRHFEERLAADEVVLPGVGSKQEKTFFHNVNADDPDDPAQGRIGAKALGGRNRWAVIYMDGNDMGMQFTAMARRKDITQEQKTRWISEMSRALDECSTQAAIKGIQRVVSDWAGTDDFDPNNSSDRVILPVRPIVVGGDDIVVLCHAAHATAFVTEAIDVFRETSRQLAQTAGVELWPATGGEVSISAGVLYCPVTLPLHTAIDYADSLLASAKAGGRHRRDPDSTTPSPACIDWDQVTDSIVDTPAARRQRELIFTDADNNNTLVKLTSRPYTLDGFLELEQLCDRYEDCPASTRHSVLSGLRQGFSDRLAFVAEVAKHQSNLAADLAEKGFELKKMKPRWKYEQNTQVTDVVDALLILEERHRMEQETING